MLPGDTVQYPAPPHSPQGPKNSKVRSLHPWTHEKLQRSIFTYKDQSRGNRQSCFEEAQHGGRCLQCHLPRVANTSSLCLSQRGTNLCRTLCQAKPKLQTPSTPTSFPPPFESEEEKKHSFMSKHCLASSLLSSLLIVITELRELNFLFSISN